MNLRSKICCLLLVLATALAARGLLAQQDRAADKKNVSGRRAQLRADIADFRRCLETKNYRRLLEFHVPIDNLRRIRKSNKGLDAVAKQLAQESQIFDKLIVMLEAIKDITPQFSQDDGVAVFDLTPGSNQPTKPKKPRTFPLDLNRRVIGLGDNLTSALVRAEALLQPDSYKEFVERTFPESELRRLDAAKRIASIVARMKARPELAAKIKSDLAAARSQRPTLGEGGRLATFHLDRTGSFRGQPLKLKPRELKFQKVNGHWRLFDNTTVIRKEVARLEILSPVVFASPRATLTFERIRDHWRLVKLPF